MWEQKQYVQFHNIKFKMLESQLLIGLETSFKNWQKALNVNIYYILKEYIWCNPLPPAYGLYTCENVDIFGRPLKYLHSTYNKDIQLLREKYCVNVNA